jgi:hypothetical protein
LCACSASGNILCFCHDSRSMCVSTYINKHGPRCSF